MAKLNLLELKQSMKAAELLLAESLQNLGKKISGKYPGMFEDDLSALDDIAHSIKSGKMNIEDSVTMAYRNVDNLVKNLQRGHGPAEIHAEVWKDIENMVNKTKEELVQTGLAYNNINLNIQKMQGVEPVNVAIEPSQKNNPTTSFMDNNNTHVFGKVLKFFTNLFTKVEKASGIKVNNVNNSLEFLCSNEKTAQNYLDQIGRNFHKVAELNLEKAMLTQPAISSVQQNAQHQTQTKTVSVKPVQTLIDDIKNAVNTMLPNVNLKVGVFEKANTKPNQPFELYINTQNTDLKTLDTISKSYYESLNNKDQKDFSFLNKNITLKFNNTAELEKFSENLTEKAQTLAASAGAPKPHSPH